MTRPIQLLPFEGGDVNLLGPCFPFLLWEHVYGVTCFYASLCAALFWCEHKFQPCVGSASCMNLYGMFAYQYTDPTCMFQSDGSSACVAVKSGFWADVQSPSEVHEVCVLFLFSSCISCHENMVCTASVWNCDKGCARSRIINRATWCVVLTRKVVQVYSDCSLDDPNYISQSLSMAAYHLYGY